MFERKDFLIGEKTVLGRARFSPPFKVQDEMRTEARFVYVVKGHSRLYAPQHSIELQDGDCVLMKCDNFVNHWLSTESYEPNEVIIFQLHPEILQELFQGQKPSTLGPEQKGHAVSAVKLRPHLLLSQFQQGMRAYLQTPQAIQETVLKLKLQELIHLFLHTPQPSELRTLLSNLFQTHDFEFEEVIRANLYENLNVEELAFLAGMSMSTFKRKFKAKYKSSPNQYFIQKRLEKAQYLLSTSDLRISEIAYQSGFNDLSHFSKTFHTQLSTSPTDYRKQQLDQNTKPLD